MSLSVPAALIASLVFTADGVAHTTKCQKVHGRTTVAMPVALPLRARVGNLLRENAAATQDGLSRLATHRRLTRFRRAGLLVPIPASGGAYYVSGVPEPFRVARPWTKRFIEQLAAAKRRSFGTPLRITGLTRTQAYQEALGMTNGNAAPAHGDSRSTHLTGASVDISKRRLPLREIKWLRAVLRQLTVDGLVLAIEEFRQPHFHVLVRKRFGRAAPRPASRLDGGGC